MYEQPTWEPRTDAPGSLSLPTPQAADGKGGRIDTRETVLSGRRPSGAKASVSLRESLTYLLPTPGANDMTGGEGQTREARQESGTGGPALRDIGHLLPTPMSATYEQGGDDGELRAAIQHGPGRRLLPTPRAASERTSRRAATAAHSRSAPSLTQSLELARGEIPRELESLDEAPASWNGASTSPPSDDGNTSSDDQPPAQLTIGDV